MLALATEMSADILQSGTLKMATAHVNCKCQLVLAFNERRLDAAVELYPRVATVSSDLTDAFQPTAPSMANQERGELRQLPSRYKCGMLKIADICRGEMRCLPLTLATKWLNPAQQIQAT